MKSVYTQNVFKLKSRDTFLLYCNEKKEELLPGYLLEVPVLAKLVNDFIATFNELRFVAIKGEAKTIVKGLNGCLVEMAKGVVKARDLVSQVGKRVEKRSRLWCRRRGTRRSCRIKTISTSS